jgi:hypothetical protein
MLVLETTSLIVEDISVKEFNNWVYVCLDGDGEK